MQERSGKVGAVLNGDRKRDADTNAKLPKTCGRKNQHAENEERDEKKLGENNIVILYEFI